MDTKLKSFNQNKITRTFAFLLCVVFFLGSLTGFGCIYGAASMSSYGTGIDDILLYDSYEESAAFQREFDDKLNNILYMLDEYKSEAYINSGKTISEQRLDEELQSMFYGDGYGYSSYSESGDSYTVTISGGSPYEKYGGGEYYDPAVQAQFKADYAEQIEELKKSMIMDDLRNFEQLQNELEGVDGFDYYVTDGIDVLTNVASASAAGTNAAGTKAAVDLKQFAKAPAYLIYENDDLEKVPASFEGVNGSMRNFDKALDSRLD